MIKLWSGFKVNMIGKSYGRIDLSQKKSIFHKWVLIDNEWYGQVRWETEDGRFGVGDSQYSWGWHEIRLLSFPERICYRLIVWLEEKFFNP